MSIKLKYWLLRNKRSIRQFIADEQINSYEEVLLYCEKRGCDPISEEEYSKAIKTSDQKKEEAVAKTVPKAAKSKNVTKAKRTKRSTKAQTKRKPRTRKTQDKKQEGHTD